MKARILLADDFPAFTDLVEGLLDPAFDVVGRVSDGEALVREALKLNPDVIITDISMPVLSGIDAVRKLRQVGSRAEVMFLTIHSGADFVRLCLAVGAKAYVVKSQLDNELLPALREIIAGRSYISAAAENTN
jgi:DNA-binding NarL/FixJ family response regulator